MYNCSMTADEYLMKIKKLGAETCSCEHSCDECALKIYDPDHEFPGHNGSSTYACAEILLHWIGHNAGKCDRW